MTYDWVFDILKKAITVGIVAIAGKIAEGAPLEYRALAMIAGYSIWIKVIVPSIDEWFNQNGRYTAAREEKSGFELI